MVYLVASKARSRAAGYFYLGNKDGKLFNGPIFILAKVTKAVMASAAEAKYGGLYMNTQESLPIKNTLIKLVHIQPPDVTPVRTGNSTADGITNRTVKPKKSKSMDMGFWWLVDRVQQNQSRIFWAPVNVNLSDYFSKKKRAFHYMKVRPIYLYIHEKYPTFYKGEIKSSPQEALQNTGQTYAVQTWAHTFSIQDSKSPKIN